MADPARIRSMLNGTGVFVAGVVLAAIAGMLVPGTQTKRSTVESDYRPTIAATTTDAVTGDGTRELLLESEHPAVPMNAAELLQSMGWTQDAAVTVVEFNQHYFSELRAADSEAFQSQIALLGRLQGRPAMLAFLESHPEFAGLLAGAVVSGDEDANLLLKVLVRFQREPVVHSLFTLSATPEDSIRLAQALDRDGDLIVRLVRNDSWYTLPWLLSYPGDVHVRRIFRKWVRDVIRQATNSGDPEAIDRATVLLTLHAPAVVELLTESEEFRDSFLTKHWPNLSRILERKSDEVEWGIFVSEPGVWRCFHELGADAVELFGSLGPLTVDLLMDPLMKPARPQVLDALRHSDETVLAALFNDELRSQPLFVDLLQRELKPGVLSAALGRLQSRPDTIPDKLAYFTGLDNSVLEDEVGPPPEGVQTWLPGYSLYYLSTRWIDGRRISGLDAVLAVADTALDVCPIVRGSSKGLKFIQKTVTNGLMERGVQIARKTVGTGSARTLLPWVLRESFAAPRHQFTALRRAACVDITGVIRHSFRYSGVGHHTFQRLTGLEARVFMRSDRRVLWNLGDLAGKHHIVGRVARHVMEEAAKDLVEPVIDHILPAGTDDRAAAEVTIDAAAELEFDGQPLPGLDRTWKRHMATWWLASAMGVFTEQD